MLVDTTTDIELLIEAKTNKDRIVEFEYKVYDIPCVIHHYTDVPDEISDSEIERTYCEAQEWFEDNMNLYDLTGYAIENDVIDEDEELTEWTFKNY